MKLAQESDVYNDMTEKQKNFLDILLPLNIEARYPTQKQDILEALNEENCKSIVNETEDFVLWIKNKL